jgi:hypothetical protein
VQIAAEAGHLQLCDFLLQEFTVCRFDAQIHEALMGFLGEYWFIHARSGSRLSLENYDGLTEAFYKLFLAKYGFSADLSDRSIEYKTTLSTFGGMDDVHRSNLLTERALEDIIASQPIPFSRWSLSRRFGAAVDSQGWPADCFVKLVDFDTITHLAQYKDARGTTALHWAAKQLGIWMSHYEPRVSQERVNDRREEYGNLLVKLITAGADVHALDSQNRTPFACMSMSPYTWTAEMLAVTTRRWGDLLNKAGVSLREFLEHENQLTVEHDNIPVGVGIYDFCRPWTYRLLLVETTTLAMEVGASLICPVWEFHPPPGAWNRKSGQIDKVIWPPSYGTDGDDWYLWQEADEIVINLAPKLLREVSLMPSLAESIFASWAKLLHGVQDDHGFVATIVKRASTISGKQKQRRRAASLPPPITMYGRHHRPVAESGFWFDSSRWLTEPHKCPLHLAWKLVKTPEHYNVTDYRRCMQGRCDSDNSLDWSDSDDWRDSDHWEAQLLKDEHNVDIARRFTDRFRPHWRGIVEENHLRAQRRAELEISVARA